MTTLENRLQKVKANAAQQVKWTPLALALPLPVTILVTTFAVMVGHPNPPFGLMAIMTMAAAAICFGMYRLMKWLLVKAFAQAVTKIEEELAEARRLANIERRLQETEARRVRVSPAEEVETEENLDSEARAARRGP